MYDLPACISLPRVEDAQNQRANDTLRDAVNRLLRAVNAQSNTTSEVAQSSSTLFSFYVPATALVTGQVVAQASGPSYVFYPPQDTVITGWTLGRLGAAITAGYITAALKVGSTYLQNTQMGIYNGDDVRHTDGLSVSVPALTGVSIYITRSGDYAQASGGLSFTVYGRT